MRPSALLTLLCLAALPCGACTQPAEGGFGNRAGALGESESSRGDDDIGVVRHAPLAPPKGAASSSAFPVQEPSADPHAGDGSDDSPPPGCAADGLAPGDHRRQLTHDGRTRSYRVHIPSTAATHGSAPLVIDLHDLNGDGANQSALSGWRELAEQREDFLLVHPEAMGGAWTAGDYCCGPPSIDDVDFVRAVIRDVAEATCADTSRVYATGLGNGGMLSQLLACDAADVITAIAPIAGSFPRFDPANCRPSRPIPVVAFHGVNDPVVPYEGGILHDAQQGFALWGEINGCDAVSDDGVMCERFTGCDAGVNVTLCSLEASHDAYVNDDGIDVARRAWRTLSQFSL